MTASVFSVPVATFVIFRSAPAAPTETVSARSAREPEPSATALLADAIAPPPIATASTPSADESTRVELVWKYLMPPPLLMVLSVVLMMLMSDAFRVTRPSRFESASPTVLCVELSVNL
ncbi:hypothetical protein BG58_08495 [Caballeronia jiangsuensis]|nr:hypothetical protein BG58_08495 [Caballeronia jiangsuensis]